MTAAGREMTRVAAIAEDLHRNTLTVAQTADHACTRPMRRKRPSTAPGAHHALYSADHSAAIPDAARSSLMMAAAALHEAVRMFENSAALLHYRTAQENDTPGPPPRPCRSAPGPPR